jgi:hypothetical protein
MELWQHALVEHSNYANAVLGLPKENDVATVPVTTKPRANVISTSAEIGVLCKPMKTGVEPAKISMRLFYPPSVFGVLSNCAQVGSSRFGDPKRRHRPYSRPISASRPSSE